MLRQEISDKRDKSVNQDRKDDELDEHKYSLEDLPPYIQTVENHSNKLHDSSKTFSRSLTTLNRKRKSRERYKMNPLNEINSERINIPHRTIIGPQQYGKAEQFLDFSSIPCMCQDKNDIDPSNGFTQMIYESFEEYSNIVDKETTSNKKSVLITSAKSHNLISIGYYVPLTQPCGLVTEKIDEYELNDKVEKNVSLQNKNGDINVEIVSKAMTDSKYIIANNENNKDNNLETDLIVNNIGLIVNSNNNNVEFSDVVKDRSKICSKENIKENDMVV